MSSKTIQRREFLGNALALAGCSALRVSAQVATESKDEPATHNWMLVGGQTAFLSHLPMFDHLNESGDAYVTPHRYQAILQVSFTRGSKDVTNLYFADRQSHPATKMFTVSPAGTFVLPDLAAQPVSSFDATVFRGHLERGGRPISNMSGVTVKVARVVHFHKFEPAAAPADALEYFIFGRGKELYLAHSILKPPDFDQIVSVEIGGADFSDADLGTAIPIHVPGRKNTPAERVHEGDQVSAEFADGTKRTIRGLREFYFEEGELLMPATFRPTPEEIKAGFAN
jgi:hypothetical protein